MCLTKKTGDAPLAPVRAEVLSGFERVKKLTAGHGFADVTAVVTAPFGGQLNAGVRGQVGIKPTDTTSFFGFAEATLKQVQAGLGFAVNW